jgi:hypothetical protein
MSDSIQRPFQALADAMNRDGHPEAGLRAELMGAMFGASFDMFKKAWGMDSSDGKNSTVLDPLMKPIAKLMDSQTQRVMQEMERDINAALQHSPYGPPRRP